MKKLMQSSEKSTYLRAVEAHLGCGIVPALEMTKNFISALQLNMLQEHYLQIIFFKETKLGNPIRKTIKKRLKVKI